MMRTTTIAVSLLILASLANADDRNRRRNDRDVSGMIAWSTRDRSGNTFGISFDFSDRGTRLNVGYRQNRYGRNSYGRNDRYNQRSRNHVPPHYDYRRYRRGAYDHHHFGSYQEWNDWRNWQARWYGRRGWQRNDRERARAWKAFQHERQHAYRAYDNRRYNSSRNGRRSYRGDRGRYGRRG